MSADRSKTADELRKRAEALLQKLPEAFQHDEYKSIGELAHELAVHQAELEVQNEELRDTYLALQQANDHYLALFQYAPVGYVVLDAAGIIRKTNTTWQAMVGWPEGDFRGKPFAETLLEEDAPVFLARFRVLFRNPGDKRIVVRIKRNNAPPFYAQIEARLHSASRKNPNIDSPSELLIIVSDISELQQAQKEIEARNSELSRANARLDHIYRVLLGIRNVSHLIVDEDDAGKLIERACESLTEKLGYESVWIALLGGEASKALGFTGDEAVVATASAGFDGDFGTMHERLTRGEFTSCMKRAFDSDETIVTNDPASQCPDCPLYPKYSGRAVLVRRLAFDNRTYGILTASVPTDYAQDAEEKDLFSEVARDLAFALHKIATANSLEESRRRYFELFEHSRDGFVMMDAKGHILDANEAYCDMLEYSLDELLMLSDFRAITPERWHEWEKTEIWETRLMGQGYSGLYEKEFIRKDGTVFPVEMRSYTVWKENGEIDYIWGTARDITEHKLAIEAIHKERKQLLSIFGSIDEVIYIADPHTYEILYVNPAFENILQKDVVGGVCYREFYGFDTPCAFCTNSIILKQNPQPFRWEHYNPKRDRHYSIVDRIIKWPDGRDVRFEMAIDVTDRKRAEEEKDKLADQLQQAMKMEAVGRLAGGIAHDFNNLLTGITGNVQLALMDVISGDPLEDTLAEIADAADSAASLTRQLLAFSRKQLIEPKALNLNELISSIHKMLIRLIGEDIELKAVPGKNLGSVKVDPGQFEQILINLAVNARDAMPNGGKLIIETGNVELDEEYCNNHASLTPGAYVMLAVSDTGMGMSAETKSHLFEPFFTTKEQGRGTGLGLATIYGAVKQVEGNIEVYSEEGKGTTFKIYLPLVHEKAVQLIKEALPIDLPGGNETILVVEDEKSVREMAIKILMRLGYNVLHASNGREALSLTENYKDRIDLLMTDVVMPGMNGRQLAEQLSMIQPEMRVLYTSGYTENAIAHHCVIDEGLHFIGKPYTPQGLAKKLRTVLESSEE